MSNFFYYRRYNENAMPSTGSLGKHRQSVPSKVLEPLLQVCVCVHQGRGCSLCFLSTGSHTEGASSGIQVGWPNYNKGPSVKSELQINTERICSVWNILIVKNELLFICDSDLTA